MRKSDTINMQMIAIIFDFNRTIFNPVDNKLTEGALDLLASLNTVPSIDLFLVAKDKAKRYEQIDNLNIKQFFKEIIIEPEKTVGLFIHCRKQCPEETRFFVVGDRVNLEIKLGNECGMTTIWFKSGKFAVDSPNEDIAKPDHIIRNLADVLPIIRNQ